MTVVTACPASWSERAIRNGSRRPSRRTSTVWLSVTSGVADPGQARDARFDGEPERAGAEADRVVDRQTRLGRHAFDLRARLAFVADRRRVQGDSNDLRGRDQPGHTLVEVDEGPQLGDRERGAREVG